MLLQYLRYSTHHVAAWLKKVTTDLEKVIKVRPSIIPVRFCRCNSDPYANERTTALTELQPVTSAEHSESR
jgi:hypothetical protein